MFGKFARKTVTGEDRWEERKESKIREVYFSPFTNCSRKMFSIQPNTLLDTKISEQRNYDWNSQF